MRQECSPFPGDGISPPLRQSFHDGFIGEIKEKYPTENKTIKCINTLRTSLVTLEYELILTQTKSTRKCGSDRTTQTCSIRKHQQMDRTPLVLLTSHSVSKLIRAEAL